jgi:N-methylhydantoinase B
MATIDPIQVEVWRHLFASIAEEMGATLERTGYSPNIKERRDYSCALFDSDGRLLAQAAHIPVHLGAMPLMMQRLRHTVKWQPGSMWLCNDPAHGGTHLPDLTIVAPVFSGGRGQEAAEDSQLSTLNSQLSTLLGFVANRAHHADIGGMSPGSMPLSTELIQEGLVIPPVRYVTGGRVNSDLRNLVCSNSRTPKERRGDLAAQVSANQSGIRRFQELVERYGLLEVQLRADEARTYAGAVVRQVISSAPQGVYRRTDYLDDDGVGNIDLSITVTVTIRKGRISFDFTGTAQETAGPMNATEAVTRSACYYVVRCLVDEDIPMNDGAFAAIEVVAPEGTLVNARQHRAVSAGNVETSQRITDVVLGALAQAFPDRIPAASQGTMNNLMIGGTDPLRGNQFAYYETICGGGGASASKAGASAVHTHMTNTRNTPIEALEMHYPLRVREYSIREGSGGAGKNRGGDGVVRSVELTSPAQVSIVSERRRHRPPGAAGGNPGAAGRNRVANPDGSTSDLPGKASITCDAGTVITLETPGGGGHGRLVGND